MPIARLSQEEMDAFAKADADDPAITRLYELTVEHAQEKGGEVLEFWELHMGRLFGKPWMMTVDEVATRLDLPISAAAKIQEDSNAEILPRWYATPEFADSPYREKHEERQRRQS